MIHSFLSPLPIVAILRGLTPDTAVEIAEVLYGVGIRAIEVPMNSPNPIESIRLMRESLKSDCAVGAGTVTSIADCQAVLDTGARLIISPHTDSELIRFAVANGGIALPGVFTPTDAFQAIQAGAHGLKLFPASTGGLEHYKALKAVLPKSMPVLAVGGINAENASIWLSAGVQGIGIGTAIFKPDWSREAVQNAAQKFVQRIQEAR